MKKFLLFSAFSLFILICATAQISLTTAVYGQDFNTYLGNSATIPLGWSTTSTTFRGIGTGTNNSGGNWALGSSSEYSFGTLTSNSTNDITMCVDFVNNTGQTITSIDISYNFEQWRYANNEGFTVTGEGALAGSDLSGLDQLGSSTGTNGTVSVTPKNAFISGLNIGVGQTFAICWEHVNGIGSDNAISVDDFNILLSLSPLPVSFTSFTAQSSSTTVVLSWSTSSEDGNDYFAVEQSSNGRDFREIGQVAGSGWSSVDQAYSFIQENVRPGIQYYRLRQVDFNGRYEYSPIVSVEINKNGAVFLVYPTNARNEVHIDIPENTGSDATIQIFDANGNVIYNEQVGGGKGTITIDVDGFTPGAYFIRFRNGNQYSNGRFFRF